MDDLGYRTQPSLRQGPRWKRNALNVGVVHPSIVFWKVRKQAFRADRVHPNVRPYLRRRLDTRPGSEAV